MEHEIEHEMETLATLKGVYIYVYKSVYTGTHRVNIRVIQGFYGDYGTENGDYYSGLYKDITPTMENHMEKNIENEMETLGKMENEMDTGGYIGW